MADLSDIQPLTIAGISNVRPIVVAGPCSAESKEQVMETARELAGYGVQIYRAGLWKPRTHPGTFEGVGETGLAWLSEVKTQTGMLVATEVATRAHVEAALNAGIDLMWIGARTSANPFAMQEIADALAGHDVPVLVKNPVNPDIELWIGAIQRLLNAGIARVGAIHRGFSVYGQHVYRNMPQWYIPIELHRRLPKLTLFCDPSHIAGRRDLIETLSQQSMDMGFDGLVVEVHCNPDCALSDSRQQITPAELDGILHRLVIRNTTQSTEGLDVLRRQMDAVDSEILEALGRRMKLSDEIGLYKRQHEMPIVQPERYDRVLNTRVSEGAVAGLNREFVYKIYCLIHEESVRRQIEKSSLMGE